MNKYVRGLVVIPCGAIKMAWTKLFHMNYFNGPIICQISPKTEITLDWGGGNLPSVKALRCAMEQR